MLVYLTTHPFCDWGENWPAWFQEESVNHGLAGLMASCLSLMLIGVNWGFQYTVVLSGGLFVFPGGLLHGGLFIPVTLLSTKNSGRSSSDNIPLFALLSLSEAICSHHIDFHSTGLIFATIPGVTF